MSASTRRRWTPLAHAFLNDYNLTIKSNIVDVDLCLDTELVRLYLTGEENAPGRDLFYAVRWLLCVQTSDLRLANQSRLGHLRETRTTAEYPETWEATLLHARGILDLDSAVASPSEKACAAIGLLLSFDIYGRSSDLPLATRAELRPPVTRRAGPTGSWTLTLWPSTEASYSKTRTQDDTVIVGGSNPDRAWLAELCGPLKRHSSDPRLLAMSPSRYLTLFHAGRARAGLWPSHAHRLRHGGASADGLAGAEDTEMAQRGRWSSLKSVRRYRRPAQYLRQLARLSPQQLTASTSAVASLRRDLPVLLRKPVVSPLTSTQRLSLKRSRLSMT